MNNRRNLFLSFVLLFYGAMATICAGADRYVSLNGTNDTVHGYTNWAGAATNIEWAVNAASAGDTVWVSNGTYYLTNQVTIAISVKLRSWPDGLSNRDTTIVNGNYPDSTTRCFYVTHDAGNPLIEGFTITNGYCIDAGTSSRDGGGGVRMRAGTLRNCLITGNSITNGNGGGVLADATWASPVITNCNLIGNMAFGDTSASKGYGGGAYLLSNAQIWNSRILHNESKTLYMYGGGGGVYGGMVYNCAIVSNTAYRGGGGVNCSSLLRNCLVARNVALGSGDVGGGGVYVYQGVFNIESCTIASNIGRQAGIWMYSTGTLNITNTIAYDNETDSHVISNIRRHTSYANAVYCDRVCTTNTVGVTFVGNGNITNQAPGFVDAAENNFRLVPKSPCINAGLNLPWMDGGLDLDNHSRIDRFSGRVDMGCYEHHPRGVMFKVR